MIRLRIVGLALVAVFAMSAVAAVSASAAAPEWHECVTGTNNTTNCPAGSKGETLKTTLAVASEGRLELENTAVGVKIKCPEPSESPGTDKGTIGPGSTDKITSITSETGAVKVPCEVVTGTGICGTEATAEAVHLPWTTKLVAGTGTEIRDNIEGGTGGEPGYKTVCKGGLKATSTCTGKTSTKATNTLSPNWNVLEEFEAKSAEATCTPTGKGKITGTNTILHPTGTTGIYVE